MSIRNFFILFALVLTLSACAPTRYDQSLSLSWSQRQYVLSNMIDWQFRGDFILKMPGKKLSANIFWQQQAALYQIMLFGPFGIGSVTIEGGSDFVQLKDNRGHAYSAQTPEALLQRQVGWSLPVSSLYYWVRGLPAPGRVDQLMYDEFHRIQHMEQQGWSIDYVAYQRVQQLELPREIRFMHDKIYLDLTIEGDSWKTSR